VIFPNTLSAELRLLRTSVANLAMIGSLPAAVEDCRQSVEGAKLTEQKKQVAKCTRCSDFRRE
jgi:hypothetical protein